MNYTIQANADESFVLKNSKEDVVSSDAVVESPPEVVEILPEPTPEPVAPPHNPRAAPLENYRTTVPGEWFGGTSWSTKRQVP
jgi:hypothetical protein